MSKSKLLDKKSNRQSDIVAEVTVSFGEKFQASPQFDRVFQEGMSLVERSASYLDGEGRKVAKTLDGHLSVLYTTESMRLTTRLLDLASWLLIRRALKQGEITQTEAQKKRERVKLDNIGRPSHIREFQNLPNGLRELIDESFSLQDRIIQLDLAMGTPRKKDVNYSESYNPVHDQLLRLENALSQKIH